VIKRYQIQDIVAQDASGIVFQALDTETQGLVAVRRFFPFGADGEGLQGEEQIAYEIAISRLAHIRHPGLRGVISGGCDPVDGMPFIATEWIEGETLEILTQGQPLNLEHAIHVITRAMEVSELLSAVLSEEGMWVETELDSIVVGRPDGGRGVTFWISPLKWLGRSGAERDFDSIILLTERLMGWRGQAVSDGAGRGLGGWLNWLRSASATTSLSEAREMLAAATGLEPPPPTQQLVRQATRPSAPIGYPKARKKSISGPLLSLIVLCLITAGLLGWILYQGDSPTPRARGGLAQLAAELAAEEAARQSAKVEDPPIASQPDKSATPMSATTRKSDADRIFTADDPKLLQQEGTDLHRRCHHPGGRMMIFPPYE
jgi:hypothetical protein